MKKLVVFIFILLACNEDNTIPEKNRYTLSVQVSPAEGGSVFPTTGEYTDGSQVTIQATPNQYFNFIKWGGDGNGTKNNPLSVTINSNISLIAEFGKNDSDNDGITDDIDECPDTSDGSNVDDNGCCVESDYVSFQTTNNLPEPRAYGSSASLDEFIYLSKGAKINQDNTTSSRTKDLIRYDIANDSWTELTSELIEARYGNTEIYNSKIYLLNGDIYGGLNDSIEVFNLVTNKLSKLNIVNPYPMEQNGSDIWNYHNIVFFGGKDKDGLCTDRIVKFNLNDQSFEVIGNLPFPICNTKGEIIDDKLYIIGGYLGSEVSDKILVYDLNTNLWEDPITMSLSISAHTTTKYKEKIFIRGDYNVKNVFAVFDTNNKSFRVIESDAFDSRHLMSEIVDGKLYVLGGNISSQWSTILDEIQVLDLDNQGYFCY
tara:strand:+ start:883 stop:2169 length:1287 start_codon:yes stop_codon:yes gene_type:complete